MQRKLLDKLPTDIPQECMRFLQGAPVYDSSCSPEARVYFIDKDGGYYLKKARAGTLSREAKMNAYFHKKGIGVEVVQYLTREHDWLMTASAVGEDCIHPQYLADPKRLCDTLATRLRALHELSFDDCPEQNATKRFLDSAFLHYQTGDYDKSQFPDSLGYRSEQEAYAVLCEGKDALQDKVLLHGDYCLPNVILNNWKFSAFIDVGDGGVGDRHIDLFWGSWTLWFNLKTNAYKQRFFDAYGRDKVDEERIKIVGAISVFG